MSLPYDPLQNILPEKYLVEVMLGDHLVIPSDTFDFDGQTYCVLDILEREGVSHLKLSCIKGEDIGKQYLIPTASFEQPESLNLLDYLL